MRRLLEGGEPLRVIIALILCVAALAGCVSPPGQEVEPLATLPPYPAGVHPWPRGDEWPPALQGPFELLERAHLQVPSFDGVSLDGWIYRPRVPEGVRVPVVLVSSPYYGQLYTTPEFPSPQFPSPVFSIGVAPLADSLVAQGYAVALFSVRGTGNSGGCFQMLGLDEQKDHYHLVEWLASQPWSSGRVGMTGGSYDGTTPWQAAIQSPPSLKAIVPVASLNDLYAFYHTPQGASLTIASTFWSAYAGAVSVAPPLFSTPEHIAQHAPLFMERACPEVLEVLTETWKGQVGDDRNAAFWEQRNLLMRFPEVTAAVFLAHGYHDRRSHQHGHEMEDDPIWPLLTSPKRAIKGPWAHQDPTTDDWNEQLVAWFDFWLKGIGAPPALGRVDYEDDTGAWRASTAWPPAEAREEVAYLAGSGLSPSPGDGVRAFRSAPALRGPDVFVCGLPETADGVAPAVVFVSEPLADGALLAGNPFAYLRVAADQPGGLVAVHLYATPGVGCGAEPARLLTRGVADLRFHGGEYAGKDFPLDTPVSVRIDLRDLAEAIGPGERIAVVVSYGDPEDHMASSGHTPLVSIVADGGAEASHVVLPFVEGSLGGERPSLAYPPRPFLPPSP